MVNEKIYWIFIFPQEASVKFSNKKKNIKGKKIRKVKLLEYEIEFFFCQYSKLAGDSLSNRSVFQHIIHKQKGNLRLFVTCW